MEPSSQLQPSSSRYLRRVPVPPSTSIPTPPRSTSSSPQAGPSLPSSSLAPGLSRDASKDSQLPAKKLVNLYPDPPSSTVLPSYPPPVPPVPRPSRPAKKASAGRDGTHLKGAATSAMSKREAYRHNKERLSRPFNENEPPRSGLVRVGEGADLQDGLLTPPLSLTTTTWSLAAEVDFQDLPASHIHPVRLDPKLVEPFSVDAIPSARRLWEAGMCEVTDEMGLKIKFRDIVNSKIPGRKTCVFFIRHFWCGQCQDFMSASIPELDPVILKKNNVDVVIISNGHWQIIKKYREIFGCPFPIFVDSPRRLYNQLGMTLLNNDFGTFKQADRARYNVRTVPSQLVHGIGNGLFRMPIRDPGKLTQLGGEFVFLSSSQCLFAHRMINTSDHMEAVDVAAEAGIDPELFFADPSSNKKIGVLSDRARAEVNARLEEIARLADEQAIKEAEWQRNWESRREAELDRIRRKKLERRAGRLRGVGPEFPQRSFDVDVEDEHTRRVREREAERARPWTDAEQEAVLAQALSCARITGDDGQSYEEEEEERYAYEEDIDNDNPYEVDTELEHEESSDDEEGEGEPRSDFKDESNRSSPAQRWSGVKRASKGSRGAARLDAPEDTHGLVSVPLEEQVPRNSIVTEVPGTVSRKRRSI